LQHIQYVQHPTIYFCNIKMEQLRYTFEASETIGNIRMQYRGGEGRGQSIADAELEAGSERRRARTTATGSGLGSVGRVH
jgi:hypothetical protein